MSKVYVEDGGGLLHTVTWKSRLTFQLYIFCVKTHFAFKIGIVFDEYVKGPSTKDHEGKRHMLSSPLFPTDI